MNELRVWVAMTTDVETCRSLLLGEPVDPSGLDPDELEFMKAMTFVRLDFRAIEFFEPADCRDTA